METMQRIALAFRKQGKPIGESAMLAMNEYYQVKFVDLAKVDKAVFDSLCSFLKGE